MLEDRWQDQFLRQRNTGAVKIPKDPSGRADHSSSPSWAVFILKMVIVRATLMVIVLNCASYLRLPLRCINDLELEYRIRIYKQALENAG